MKFSIIVPCYNVELYLDECIQSILSQSYRDFEVIMIDDGSTDHTHEKCEWWCNKDNRVKLITTKNGGLSIARNVGMNAAMGDYLVFVDSDDTIEKDSLLYFDSALNSNEDALITRWIEWYPDQLLMRDEGLAAIDEKFIPNE